MKSVFALIVCLFIAASAQAQSVKPPKESALESEGFHQTNSWRHGWLKTDLSGLAYTESLYGRIKLSRQA